MARPMNGGAAGRRQWPEPGPLLVEVADGVATPALNRPDALMACRGRVSARCLSKLVVVRTIARYGGSSVGP